MLAYFFLLFYFFIAVSQCQFNLVVITESTPGQLLHARYINSSSQYLQNLTYDQINIQIDDVVSLSEQVCNHMSDNQTTLFISLAESPSAVTMLKEISNYTGVPIIQIHNSPWSYHNSNSTTVSNNFVEFITPNAVFANVVPDLAKHIGIRGTVAVLYDEFYAPNEMLNSTFNNQQINSQPQPMEIDPRMIASQIDDIQNQGITNIFLVATITNAQNYLKGTGDYMANGTFKWFIITNDHSPYVCEDCLAINLLWVRPEMNISYDVFQDFQDNLVDPITINSADILLPYDKLMMSYYLDLVQMTKSAMITLNQTYSTYPSFSCIDFNETQLQIPLSQAINLSQFSGAFGSYFIDSQGRYFQDVPVKIGNIRYTGEGGRYVKTVGKWSVMHKLEKTQSPMFQDFSNPTHYTVAVAVQPPFIEQFNDTDGTIKYRGYCKDMIDKLALMAGFTYTLYQVADNKYGLLTSRGDWNGLIRDLVYGDADMALGTIRISSDKENYVDLTVPYYEQVGDQILMFNQPTSNSYFEFMTVLTPNVWICIVGAFFVTSFVLFVFDRFSPYGKHEKKKYTYQQCMWYCLTTFIPQGGPSAPKNTSCKVVAATWWLFGFVIISAYTANLAAYLTVNRLQSSINSLDDLSQQYAYRYGPVRGTETEAYLKRMMETEQRFYNIWKLETMTMTMSPDERASLAVWDYPVSDKYTNMWKFITDQNFVFLPTSLKQALDLVLASNDQGGFIYIGEGTELRYIAMTDCRFQVIGEEFNKKPYAIAVQQKNPMKDILSSLIMNLTRTGWLTNLKEKWWTNNPNNANCGQSNANDTSNGISVMNIFGVFLVTGVLMIICIITLIIEFFYLEEKLCVRRYHDHHPNRNDHKDVQPAEQPSAFDQSKYTNNYDAMKVSSSSVDNHFDVQQHTINGNILYSMY